MRHPAEAKFLSYLRRCFYLILIIGFSSVRAGAYDDFFRAVDRDDGAQVAALIARGFDANAIGPKGQNALYLAMTFGHLSVARALLTDSGLRVDSANAVGETPLMMAAMKGHLEWCQRLVHLGASVRRVGWTPLHYAASSGEPAQVRVVEFLLMSGAEVDAESPNGSTPLMLAARYGSEPVIRTLLANGADPKRRNQREMTAADFARSGGRDRLADALERWSSPGVKGPGRSSHASPR